MRRREHRGRQRLERDPREPVNHPRTAAVAHAGDLVRVPAGRAMGPVVDDRDRQAGGERGRRDGGSGGPGARFRSRSVAAGQAEQQRRDSDDADAGQLGAAEPLVQHQP